MQGWRVTCRACGAVLADVWSDENRAELSDLGRFEDEARAGEEIVEAYAGRRQSFQVSPATMLRCCCVVVPARRRCETSQNYRGA